MFNGKGKEFLMARHYNAISADGHLEVMAEFYTKYLPAKLKDRAPYTFRRPDGAEVTRLAEFENEGAMVKRGDLDDDKHVPGTGMAYHTPEGGFRPGVGTPQQRLIEQDIDNIDAEWLYNSGSTIGLWRNIRGKDPELYHALYQAYNDWLAKEYNATAPDRLMGGAIVPETGVDDAIKELERARKIGLTWVQIQNWPNGSPYYQPGDEKFFAAAVAMNMTVSPHSSFAANTPRQPQGGEGSGIDGVLYHRAAGPAMAITQFMITGIFDNVPGSKIYIGETYLSYMPFNYNRMDEHYIRRRHYYNFKLKKLPSEYIRDSMAFSFIHERPAMQLRYYTGIDNMMWGSDFPHNVNTYPYSKVSLDEMFLDVPDAERRRVLVTTPCKWFGLDPEKDITPTPASIPQAKF
jgi:predicted TIM-barrel fold metal-dependent hydrolase